jgi:hypothetical protein
MPVTRRYARRRAPFETAAGSDVASSGLTVTCFAAMLFPLILSGRRPFGGPFDDAQGRLSKDAIFA